MVAVSHSSNPAGVLQGLTESGTPLRYTARMPDVDQFVFFWPALMYW
jgi:hypothetical protein